MALPITLSYQFLDDKGATSRTEVHLPTGTTLAAAQTFASSFGDILSDITGAKITGVSMTFPVAYTDVNHPTPATDSDVEEGALFVFRDADGRIYRSRIPAFVETFMSPNSDQVDRTAVPVAAYLDAVITGLVGTAPVTLAGTDITTVSSAQDSFQRNHKR